jgi:hypothetical protein
MTISPAEFLRSLQPLRRLYRIEIDETAREVSISLRSFRGILQWQENKPVILGSLSMPSMEVHFRFSNSAPDEIASFWVRFDLCFRRGGG